MNRKLYICFDLHQHLHQRWCKCVSWHWRAIPARQLRARLPQCRVLHRVHFLHRKYCSVRQWGVFPWSPKAKSRKRHRVFLCHVTNVSTITSQLCYRSKWPPIASRKNKTIGFSNQQDTITSLTRWTHWRWALQKPEIGMGTIFKYKYIIMWLGF